MVWFGVIIAMNLQTSFLTPPFGFALFYLRSVAAKSDYKDRITGATIPAVTTAQIYKGSIAFIVLQLIMVASIIAFPHLVVGSIVEGEKIDADKALQEMTMPGRPPVESPSLPGAAPGGSAPSSDPLSAPKNEDGDDKMKGLMDAIKSRGRRQEALNRYQEQGPRIARPLSSADTGNAPARRHSFWRCMKSSNVASVKRNHRLTSRRKSE